MNAKLKTAEDHLIKVDDKLAPIIKAYRPMKLTPHSDHYGELVGSIVGQQLSTKAAAVIWQRVLLVFGGKMPTPEQLVAADDEKLRACGVSYPKIGYMKDLAAHILDKRLDLNHLAAMPNDRLIQQLTAVKGIGEWSAHMFMIFGLGRLDVLPVGDLGIKKAIRRVYGLHQLPEPVQVATIANQNYWRPYESVASWFLWKSLNNSPDKQTRHDV